MAEKLVISRYWTNPEISYEVSREGIEINMALDDYLVALTEELGNPAILLTMTKGRLLQLLREKSLVVCEKVKEATAQG